MEKEFSEQFPVNPNLKCNVCGENRFDEREGFYYCEECGTKQDQVRLVEVERDEEFDNDQLRAKKQKLYVVKAETPQLTSWECYNYILRGFVEELLSFGAKEELKLMSLQVWAAYLRRMEVAFFNRKQPDLPKLGIKYLQNDAQTIYNHSKEARKKRQRRRSEDTSCTSGDQSTQRSWNRSKRKLDESNYSLTSATSGGSAVTSSTSANSNRAIKIGFSSKAKAFFKRKMPVKHLEKHGADAEGQLKCHKQPNARDVNRTDYNMMTINTKQIYSIIAIALNLIGDDIQLCDLVRFINGGHLGTSNVLQYFPENIASSGKEMLTKINFYKCPEKFSDKGLRDHIGTVCKNVGIHTLKTPDIIKLVQRYTTELCLPTDIACFIERLINLLPPNFNTRVEGYYPGFEARAMAYIIFTLKLLFGLDDCKEHRISRASKNLNSKIEQLNVRSNEKQPLIFVWNEWTEYIEMRKVIISQFNTSYCDQFKQCQSTSQVLEQMSEEMRKTEERNDLLNEKDENLSHKLKNFKSLFENFQETYKLSEKGNKPHALIDFRPSFTPSHSYLKNILLVCNKEAGTNSSKDVNIPDFMRIDHSQRDINSFLQVKPLIDYFKKHQLKLKVHVMATTANREQIGIFRTPVSKAKNSTFHKACFEVTEEEWDEIVMASNVNNTDDLVFCSDFTTYTDYYQQKVLGTKQKQFFNPFMNYDLKMIHGDMDEERQNERIPEENEGKSSSNRHVNEDLQSMHSFEVFSENNMDPVDTKDFITKPRRNFENIDLFQGISDEESVLNDDDGGDGNDHGEDMNISASCEPVIPNQNELILEEFIKIEPGSNESAETPKTKANNASTKIDECLKMYISNMDCWMMLGNIIRTTKLQRGQLQDKFPRSFNWLLETCAQTISVEWPAVFEQLLCIETMFCLGIKDPKTIKNCVYVNSHNANKEMQMIINSCREIW